MLTGLVTREHRLMTTQKRANFFATIFWATMVAFLAFGIGFVVKNDLHRPISVHAQGPVPCQVSGTLTATGTSVVIDNRRTGCYQWRVTYSSTGFSALSI